MAVAPVRRILALGALAATVQAVAPAVRAASPAEQERYPAHPLVVVSPYPPGGGVDILLRALVGPWGKALGQPLAIDYRTGDAAATGTASVARAAPDGYTVMVGAASTVTIPEVDTLIGRPMSYKLEQLQGIAEISSDPSLLIVNPSLPARTGREFLALAHSHPGELVASSGGYYGPSHLPLLLLERAAGIRFKHLVGTGGGPAMSALLGGNAVACAAHPSIAAPHLEAGRARVVAQFGAERMAEYPDVPTFEELGVHVRFYDWFAVFGPAGLKPEVVRALQASLRAAVADPEFKATMARLHSRIEYRDGADFDAWFAREREWRIAAVRAIGRIDAAASAPR